MKTRILYFQMECKRAGKLLPFVLTGAIALAVLLGAIAFSAARAAAGETKADRIQAGIVLPEGDKLAKQGFSMLKSMESAESICDFYVVEEEEGKQGVRNGVYDCLVIVPPGMVEGILNGTNTPVQLVFPETKDLESHIFSEMVSSWVTILGSAQAGIYAADELCIRLGREDLIPEIERGLNEEYLSYALSREKMYRSEMISVSGEIPLPVFYGISFFVFYLFLCGIMMSSLLAPDKEALNDKLRLAGVGKGFVTFSRIGAVSLLMILVSVIFLAGFCRLLNLSLELPGILLILLVILGVSSIEVLVFEAAKNQMAGILILFIGSFLLIFASGGFIPAMFLPGSLRAAGPYLPAGIFMDALKMAVSKTYETAVWLRLAGLLAVTAGLLAAAGVREKR